MARRGEICNRIFKAFSTSKKNHNKVAINSSTIEEKRRELIKNRS
jgi:hypothetical protein